MTMTLAELKRRILKAKRSETIERLTAQFEQENPCCDGCIRVYDDGEMYSEELAEYALLNIEWFER